VRAGVNVSSEATGTRGDDRHFFLERHDAFQNAWRAAKRAKGDGEVAAVAQLRLALAVIAKAPRLEDRVAAEPRDGASERASVVDRGEIGGGDPEALHELFLDQPVLGERQRLRIGPHRPMRLEHLRRAGGHVLEFVRDDVDRFGKGGESGEEKKAQLGRGAPGTSASSVRLARECPGR